MIPDKISKNAFMNPVFKPRPLSVVSKCIQHKCDRPMGLMIYYTN